MTANPGAYALIGMGTAFAGIVRTPMTSVIMIFEMTRDYSIIVPLMISNLISFFISQKLQPEPIYEALALQEGVYLPTGESRRGVSGIRVGQGDEDRPGSVSADLTLPTPNKLLDEMGRNAWPVGDQKRLIGVVTTREIGASKNVEVLRQLIARRVRISLCASRSAVVARSGANGRGRRRCSAGGEPREYSRIVRSGDPARCSGRLWSGARWSGLDSG